MPKLSRDKGKRAEREVINLMQLALNEAYETMREAGRGEGYDVGETPQLERNLIQAHSGGCDMHGLDWISVEIKRAEQLQLESWWLQCLRQARKGQEPVLIYRQSFRPWRVRMRGSLSIDERATMLTCVVEVRFDDYLDWFRRRAMRELWLRTERGKAHA